MPILNFYRTDAIQRIDGPHLFQDSPEWNQTPQKPYNSVEELLSSFFKSRTILDLPVLKHTGTGKNKTSEWEKYKCEVLRQSEGVVLMTIENNKSKSTIVHKQEEKHEHHPYCYVVTDFRSGHMIIGIEKNSAFDGDPNKVAAIISGGMSNLLMPYGKRLELCALKKTSTEFWPIVEDVRTRFKDRIRQIRWDYNGEEDSSGEDGTSESLMRLFSAIARKAESEAVFMLNASSNESEVNYQKVYDDLTHMAEICLKNKGYDLCVKFKKFGIYRYGADLMAQFGTEEKVLTDFVNEAEEPAIGFEDNFTLVTWMDKINELLQGYAKATALPAGRKTRHRK